jgi:hypothetical protein
MSHRQVPWIVHTSAAFYRRLLVLYPRSFRQECAADMAQVFRDCACEAHQRNGAAGVLTVWSRALTDLAVTVLAERSAQMSKSTVTQLGGLCLMIGSVLGGIVVIINRMIGFAVFLGVLGDVWLAVAAVLFIPGIIALHLHLAGSGGGWRWLGTVLAVSGVLSLALGQFAFGIHLGGTVQSCGYQCISFDYPHSFLSERLYSLLQFYGTWFAVVGLGTLSVIALLSRSASRRTVLPAALVVGYVTFTSLPPNAPALVPGTPLLLLWVVAAFLLGRDLWKEAAAGTSSALGMGEAGDSAV